MPTRIRAVVPDVGRSRVEATTADGHLLAFDRPPPGGEGSAAGPKESLLAALAACAAFDVAGILRKKRQRVTSYEIVVVGEAATEHPRVWTSIVVEHVVTGMVEAEALRRSVELSSTRYCPVSAMLSASVVIEHRYRLTVPGAEEQAALVATTGPAGSQVL